MEAYRDASASSTRTTPLRTVWIVTSTFCCLGVRAGRTEQESGRTAT
jgi:hypothetical protein